MINFKFIGLFSVIFVFIIGGIYLGFLEFNGDKNLFSQISGVSGDDFQYVGEIELENNFNDFADINSGQKEDGGKKNSGKAAKRDKKNSIINNGENIVKVVSGAVETAVPAATSTEEISAPVVENNSFVEPLILAQEQNQEQVATSSVVPILVVPDEPAVPNVSEIPAVQSNFINHILTSEIMAGIEGGADYDFIELFNPTSQSIDLTGWSIKKRSSTGSESTLVSSSRLEGKIIPPGKYFLLANEGGYGGQISPDVFWPKSYTLAYSNNAAIIYNSNGELVEEVSWTEILKGQSIERVSWDNNEFKIQPNPNPQNSESN